MIKHIKGKGYCVLSHQTGKSFGCYPTKAAAEKRLAQVKMFGEMKRRGYSRGAAKLARRSIKE